MPPRRGNRLKSAGSTPDFMRRAGLSGPPRGSHHETGRFAARRDPRHSRNFHRGVTFRPEQRADLHQGRRADHVREVRHLPSPRRSRADDADVVRRCPAVGQGDQGQSRGARDAAVGRRSRAHAEDAERPQPVRERRSRRSPPGSMPARRAATPPTCRRRRNSPKAGPTAASPTTSSRCRSSSTFRPRASCRC